jgi:hypothetical protein
MLFSKKIVQRHLDRVNGVPIEVNEEGSVEFEKWDHQPDLFQEPVDIFRFAPSPRIGVRRGRLSGADSKFSGEERGIDGDELNGFRLDLGEPIHAVAMSEGSGLKLPGREICHYCWRRIHDIGIGELERFLEWKLREEPSCLNFDPLPIARE